MNGIQESGETLMSICAEAPGCFEIDTESGEPMGTCVYSKLIQLGYTSQSLESADGTDGHSMNYLYRLVYPETEARTTIDKMHPERLKSISIIRKCKVGISATSANNVINKGEKRVQHVLHPRKKAVSSNGKRKSLSRRLTRQTGGTGKESQAKWGEVL